MLFLYAGYPNWISNSVTTSFAFLLKSTVSPYIIHENAKSIYFQQPWSSYKSRYLLTVTWRKSPIMYWGCQLKPLQSLLSGPTPFPRLSLGPNDPRPLLSFLNHQLNGEDSKDLAEHGASRWKELCPPQLLHKAETCKSALGSYRCKEEMLWYQTRAGVFCHSAWHNLQITPYFSLTLFY